MSEIRSASVDDLDLASDRVPAICDSLSVSDEVQETAIAICDRHHSPHGESMSMSPSSIASGAVYLSAMLANEKRTQKAVADAAGVTAATVMRSWRSIAKREGYDLESKTRQTSSRQESSSKRGVYEVVQRIKGWWR